MKARGALDAQEAEALREADRLRVWRHYGYGSLLEYMEMEMGYTPRAALERLRVAKAIVELPAIADAMAQGDLSFSAGRELTRVATPETEQQWLEATSDKNARDVEDMVSGHKRGEKPTDPVDPKLRTRPMRFDDIDDETRALLRQAREILERECGERIDDRSFLRMFGRMVIDGAASSERTRAPYQIAVTTCDRCKRGWQDGGGITVEMSPATLETALCDAQHIGRVDDADAEHADGVDAANPGHVSSVDGADAKHVGRIDGTDAKHVGRIDDADARHVGRVDDADTRHVGRVGGEDAKHVGRVGGTDAQPIGRREAATTKAPATSTTTKRAKSGIPPALRRKAKHRDHGRCRVPWCRSSRNCDQHHIVPVSQGGQHTAENLLTLCESHHIAHHEGALLIEGTASTATFTRRAHSSFAIAERAVMTARALKDLGFDKHEVKAAMERARTHVGTEELTLEQWIRIALRYCPKPRA